MVGGGLGERRGKEGRDGKLASHQHVLLTVKLMDGLRYLRNGR
jgi:hypothetical protein